MGKGPILSKASWESTWRLAGPHPLNLFRPLEGRDTDSAGRKDVGRGGHCGAAGQWGQMRMTEWRTPGLEVCTLVLAPCFPLPRIRSGF